MAKYKNREVTIVREIPHAQGDQVEIEHKELSGQKEVVPRNQVVVTKEELKAQQKHREELAKQSNAQDLNEYRVEGEKDQEVVLLPTYKEALEKKLADTHAKVHAKAEQFKDKAETDAKNWFKK